ncbi:MAG: hypothetical protein WC499_01370 [Patescibacteria group bacterium]
MSEKKEGQVPHQEHEKVIEQQEKTIEEMKKVLAEKFPLHYYTVSKNGKFFGGNAQSGEDILQENPNHAYHFNKENAENFVNLDKDYKIQEIDNGETGIDSIIFCKKICGIPMTEKEKETHEKYRGLSKEIERWAEEMEIELKKAITSNKDLHYEYSYEELAGFPGDKYKEGDPAYKGVHKNSIQVRPFDVENNSIQIYFAPHVNYKTAAEGEHKLVSVTAIEIDQKRFIIEYIKNTPFYKKFKPTIILDQPSGFKEIVTPE